MPYSLIGKTSGITIINDWLYFNICIFWLFDLSILFLISEKWRKACFQTMFQEEIYSCMVDRKGKCISEHTEPLHHRD